MMANERLATLGLVAATTAGATFVVLIAGSFGPVVFRLGYDAIAVGALVPWLVFAAVHGRGLPSSRLMTVIGACLAAFAISTVTSRAPRLSLEMLGYAVLLAGLYLLAVALMRRPTLRVHFARVALLMCAIVCLFYVVEVLQAWQTWWDLVGRPAIPPLRPAYAGFNLSSPNPVAALVLLLLGFALATVEFRGRAGAFTAALLVVLVATVVLLTGSRGAWLGTAVALIVTGVAALLTNSGARRRATAFVRSRLGAVGGSVLALLLVAAAAFVVISGRLSLAGGGREVFAAVSLRMFQSSPLTGTGPGTWSVLRAGNTTAGQLDAYVPHAHSVYWQLLAEFGLLGVAAGVVGALVLGSLIVRALRSDDTSRGRIALAALFGVVLLAVHQAVDMFMNIPPLLFAIALPIAWLDATTEKTQARARSIAWRGPGVLRQRGLPLAMAGATSLIAAGLFAMEGTTIAYLPAVAAADSGNWVQATALARRAADADPDVAAYQFTLGLSAANAGDLPLAESALTKSATADDYTYAWLNLAAVRWRLGDADGARAALSSAERLGLQRPTVALPAGWLRQQLGDQPAAIADYSAALSSAPTLAADPFWMSTADLQSTWLIVWATVQATAEARTLLVLDLAAGRFDLAAPVATILANGDRALYEQVIPAWQGDADAWDALQALAAERPADGDTLAWCQLIAEQRRDQAAIDRYRLWIEINGSPLGTRPQFARVTTAMTQPVPPSVFDSYELLYRRPVPAAQIVGLLPQVAWQGGP